MKKKPKLPKRINKTFTPVIVHQKPEPVSYRKGQPLRELNGPHVVAWISAHNSKRQLTKDGHEGSATAAALWWAANQVVAELCDLSTRELANYVLQPQPLRSVDDLTAFLDNTWDSSEETPVLEVTGLLREFFLPTTRAKR